MHAVNLLAKAMERPAVMPETKQAICCLTGEETECVPTKELLGNSFTNWDLMSAPESPYISTDAYVALSCKWERMSSWWCDGTTFERLDRQGVRKKVFAPLSDKPWVGYVTTSYKKHGALNTPVNTSKSNIWRFENLTVNLSDTAKTKGWWDALNRYLRLGIPRPVLQDGDPTPALMRKVGYKTSVSFLEWCKDKKHLPLYQFLCYLLPSQEELKAEKKEKECTLITACAGK